MIAENPTYELSAEMLTEAALRVGGINYAFLRAAREAGLGTPGVCLILKIDEDVVELEEGSAESSLFRSKVQELVARRMDAIECPSRQFLVAAASEHPEHQLFWVRSHIAGCRYCLEEVESMQPVKAPS